MDRLQVGTPVDLETRVAGLEAQLVASRRNSRRRMLTVLLLVGFALVAVAQVKVEVADLEIHPNVSGGNPNDSHMLKLIGDGASGADRAMTLHTIPTTDTDYRLAISDNGGTERVSIDDDGNVGIGDTTPNYVLDVNGDARIGWNGDSARIKILPSDFLENDDADFDETGLNYEDDNTNKGVITRESSTEIYAFVAIPKRVQGHPR